MVTDLRFARRRLLNSPGFHFVAGGHGETT